MTAPLLVLTWAAVTDVGRLRPHNEDSYLARPGLFVVADGMGGQAAGEVASALAIAEFEGLWARAAADDQVPELTPAEVTAAVADANSAILSSVGPRGERFGMGTTLTGLAVVRDDTVTGEPQGQFAVFNVGDSRVYRWRDGQLHQITIDHSEVQELVDAGQLTPEQARSYPRRNMVTRALGSEPAPLPDLWVLPPQPGDRYLLCSDGLTNELTDVEIGAVLAQGASPADAASALVEQANDTGGRDNVTVIVVDVVAPS